MYLNRNYFYSLTPREFANTVNGFRKREDDLSKERWMIGRKMMWAAAMPHCKSPNGGPLLESDLLNLPWVIELIKEFTEEDNVLLLEETEKVKEFYRLRDEKLKNNSADQE